MGQNIIIGPELMELSFLEEKKIKSQDFNGSFSPIILFYR